MTAPSHARAGAAPSSAGEPSGGGGEDGAPARVEPFTVEVVRSTRRRKTVQARLSGGVLTVRVPASISATEEQHWVEVLRGRFEAKVRSDAVDLPARAAVLARRYGLPTPSTIRWVDNQRSRWGSCTPSRGTVRLSRQLAEYPGWVVDHVIVHELAHLVEPGHSAAFHELERRYPLTERAIGFLIAKGWGLPAG